jgi:hypothetical protein
MKPRFKRFDPNLKEELKPVKSNSYLRLKAVEKRMTSNTNINDVIIKEVLRSKDDKNNPVCRANNNNGYGFTFASVVMTLSGEPSIQVVAGPPDESDYEMYDFKTKR